MATYAVNALSYHGDQVEVSLGTDDGGVILGIEYSSVASDLEAPASAWLARDHVESLVLWLARMGLVDLDALAAQDRSE